MHMHLRLGRVASDPGDAGDGAAIAWPQLRVGSSVKTSSTRSPVENSRSSLGSSGTVSFLVGMQWRLGK
jgi:hypothetical protein